jgi:hypothetical protein
MIVSQDKQTQNFDMVMNISEILVDWSLHH